MTPKRKRTAAERWRELTEDARDCVAFVLREEIKTTERYLHEAGMRRHVRDLRLALAVLREAAR